MTADDITPAAKPIPRRLRFEILRRDGHTCRYCGAQAPDVALTVDHVIPRALGGGDDPTNLVAACKDCNSGKASTSPDEHHVADVDAAAFLFARAMERAAEQRRHDKATITAAVAQFDADWSTWGFDRYGVWIRIERDPDWRTSVERFLELGFDSDDLKTFITVAMRSKASNAEKWKYFCGCCWRELTDRQELARRLIEDGAV